MVEVIDWSKVPMDKQWHSITKEHYLPGVTLITPTGDRHTAFHQLEKYVARQTYSGPLQWIVVDDGLTETVPNYNSRYDLIYIRREYSKDRAASLMGNLLEAMPHIIYNKILILEDDDWYAPKYIHQMQIRLQNYDLVGEGLARYYHVKWRQHLQNRNRKHSSLCQTALSICALKALYVSCQNKQSSFVDCRLWEKKLRKNIFCDLSLAVGIKGMPGREGIGAGHRHKISYRDDLQLKILQSWIGKEDTEFYAQFYKPGDKERQILARNRKRA